ncbi:hypothetical protein LSHI6S_00091 [Leifsonia shinshuensis]
MQKKLILGLTILGVVLLAAAIAIALLRANTPTVPKAETPTGRTETAAPTGTASPTATTTPTPAVAPSPGASALAGAPAGTALTVPGTQLESDATAAIGIEDGAAIYYVAIQAGAPEPITGEAAAAARAAAHQPDTTTVFRAKITVRALSGSVTIPTNALANLTIVSHPGSSELTNAASLPLEHGAGLHGESTTVTTSKGTSWYVYAFSADGNTPIGVQYATPTGQYAAPVTWIDPAGKQILIP